MINQEAFEKWDFKNNLDSYCCLLASIETWEYVEKLYESRKCDNCKRFSNMKIEQVDINDRESINEVRACQHIGFYNVPSNFSCKHWEADK